VNWADRSIPDATLLSDRYDSFVLHTPVHQVTLALLAGGAGSRMGQAKGLLQVRGQPILDYLVGQLRWPGPTLLVTSPGREHPPGWERFDREVCDPLPDQGPLRGVLTALDHSTTDITLFVAVDMPGVTSPDLAWFVDQLSQHRDWLGVMGHRANGIEPLPCALRAEARELVMNRLDSGRRSLHGLAEEVGIEAIDAGGLPDRTWFNANTPGEWQAFLRDLPA
jgi:molybdopterin-guanine dinucleotide biosynthesis protein A